MISDERPVMVPESHEDCPCNVGIGNCTEKRYDTASSAAPKVFGARAMK